MDSRYSISLLTCLLVLAGCDWNPIHQWRAPKTIEQYAENFCHAAWQKIKDNPDAAATLKGKLTEDELCRCIIDDDKAGLTDSGSKDDVPGGLSDAKKEVSQLEIDNLLKGLQKGDYNELNFRNKVTAKTIDTYLNMGVGSCVYFANLRGN